MNRRLVRIQLAAVVAVFIACGLSDHADSPGSAWVAGVRKDVQLPQAPSAAAVDGWRTARSEAAALGLARAYYGEYFSRAASDLAPSLALAIRLPDRGGLPVQITARGHSVQVARLDGDTTAARRQHEEAAFYGTSHFYAPVGVVRSEGAELLAARFEEYEIVEQGDEYRAKYRLGLPEGLRAIKPGAEYLELGDVERAPLLRLHYPQVRDASGALRTGTIRLEGVSALPGGMLQAEAEVVAELLIDLTGLKGPLVVDPGWSTTGAMAAARFGHSTTLLADGRLLAVGGTNGSLVLASAECFDPGTQTWSACGSLNTARRNHVAKLLHSGDVVIAGGSTALSDTATASVERFATGTNTFSVISSMRNARLDAAGVVLTDGRVLMTGGLDSGGARLSSAEIYDPSAGTDPWNLTSAAMITARAEHTATMLANGRVLLVGGRGPTGAATAKAEIFNPADSTFGAAADVLGARLDHTANRLPSGEVVVVGGIGTTGGLNTGARYSPADNQWRALPEMTVVRTRHSATVLPSGKLLVVGGMGQSTAELYDPGGNSWSNAPPLTPARGLHTATLLPSGKVLVIGGNSGTDSSPTPLATSAVYDPGSGPVGQLAPIPDARGGHTSTLLTDGRVLVAGGSDPSGAYRSSAAVYDPARNVWTSAASMSSARAYHTATLLPSGKVLIAGGVSAANTYLKSAEVFNPADLTWAAVASMTDARSEHTATLLNNGNVLVAGGFNSPNSAEVYEPATDSWTRIAMTAERRGHTATILPSGKVLIAGGFIPSNGSARSDTLLFAPSGSSGSFTAGANMMSARWGHSAIALPSGRVLVTGGYGSALLDSAEIYDEPSNVFSALTTTLSPARRYHTSTLLPSGLVMLAGGESTSAKLSTIDFFDVLTGSFSAGPPLSTARAYHTATLLPSAKVLVAGGLGASAAISSVEIVNPSGAADAWRPMVTAPGTVSTGFSAVGSRFLGVAATGGGGFNDSSTDRPVVAIQSIDTGVLRYGVISTYTDTTVSGSAMVPVNGGRFILWVGANGIFGGRIVRQGNSNSAPTASGQTLTTNEDTPLNFTLEATDPELDGLTYSIAAPAMGAITGPAPYVTYTPTLNENGSDAITFTVSDGTVSSNTATVSITVVPQNDPPTVDSIPDVTMLEDSTKPLTLTNVGPGGGADEFGQQLTFSTQSSAPTIVPPPTVDPSTKSFTLAPLANAVGTANVTVTVADNGGGANSTTARVFQVTVTPVNDPPTMNAISNVTYSEDATPSAITLSGVGPGGGSDEQGQIVTLTATSSNTALIQNLNATLSGTNGTLTYTLGAHQNGTATITVRATDNGSGASPDVNFSERQFQITVTAVNDPPVMTDLQPINLAEDSGAQSVALAGVGPGGGPDEASQTVSITAATNDATLTGPVSVSGTQAPYFLNFTPPPNANGSATISLTLTDSLGATTTKQVTVNVAAVNDVPTIDGVATQSLLEDGAQLDLTLTGITAGGGGTESAQLLSVSATSSDTALLPHPTITGTGASRQLRTSPASNANGAVQITVTVTDDGTPSLSTTTTFTVNVQAVNDSPVFNAIANATIAEDVALSVNLAGVSPGGGADEANQSLTFAVASSNTALIASGQVTQSGSNWVLAATPAADAVGSATLTVTLTDSGGASFSSSFNVTVTAVNDAPMLAAVANETMMEDAPAKSVSLTGIAPGGGPDESAQAITVSATTDNPLLITNLTVTGSGATRTLEFTPAANRNGTATVTVAVVDNGGGATNSTQRTFTVTVNAVNDAPTLDALSPVTLLEDSAQQTVTLSGIAPGGGPDETTQTLTITAASGDPTVVATPMVSGNTVAFAPQPNANGTTTVTVTVTDSGGIANSGQNSTSRTFLVTVTPVNDAPSAAAISNVSILEDAAAQTVTVSTVSPGGGADEGVQTVTLTTSSSNPALVPNPTVTGTTLTFTPAADQNGTATITVLLSDSGGVSNGGVNTATRTFTVTVAAVNDQPTMAGIDALAISEDAPTRTLTLTGIGPGGGSDEATQQLTLTAVATNTALLPDLSVTPPSSGSSTLSFTAPAHMSGTTTVTVTLNDNGATTSPNVNTLQRTFTVTVNAVNDPPTIDEVENRAVLKDSGSSQVLLTGIGPGGGADEATQTVTLTATSSNPALVPNPTISGSGSSRVMTYRPVAGAVGVTTITINAKDSGGTANGGVDSFSRTFTITVEKLANQTPVAQAGSATSDGSPVAVTLKATDLDNDTLTFAIVTQPTKGALSGDAPNLTYTPEAGFSGVDSFTFKVNDGTTDSEPATFSITVNAGGIVIEGPRRSHYGWSLGCTMAPSSAAPWLAVGALAAIRLFRRRRGAIALLVALVLGAAGAARAEDEKAPSKKPKLAFLGVSAGAGVAAETATSVSGYVQSELIALDAYEVIGTSEISAMIGFERQKQLLGCSDDSNSCLAEMAGALDADRAISGDISQVGSTTLLNISLIDLRTSKPVSRVGKRVDGQASSEAVLDAGRAALLELLGFDPALKGRQLSYPRGFGGLFVAARGEADIAGGSVSPGVMAELSGKRFGGAVSVLVGPSTGFRGEARFYPVELGIARPYLAAGGTVFAPAVGLRGAAGVAVRFGQVHVFSDAAYEHFVNDNSNFYSDAVLLSLGAGWLF